MARNQSKWQELMESSEEMEEAQVVCHIPAPIEIPTGAVKGEKRVILI